MLSVSIESLGVEATMKRPQDMILPHFPVVYLVSSNQVGKGLEVSKTCVWYFVA